MSYILDALRRAEAERQRGTVPGLHAQPLPGSEAPAGPRGLSAGVRVVLLAAVLVVAAGGLWLLRSPAPVSPAPVAQASGPPALPGASSSVPPSAPWPPPLSGQAPDLAPAPAPVARAVAPVGPASARPMARSAAAVEASPSRIPRPVAPPLRAAAASAPPPAPMSAGAVPRLAELPDTVRRELPALKLGGSMYSDSPASRALIVNDQLLHEGDSPAPGLVLEHIGPRSAQLRWHEQRFELPY